MHVGGVIALTFFVNPLACADGGSGQTDGGTDVGSGGGPTGEASGSSPESTGEDGGSEASGSPSPSPSCDTPLTDWERMMVDSHNEWRSSVAPPAANMNRVYWDTEIANNAASWVASCDPDWPHSPEESRTGIGGYEVLGENLSYCAGSGCADDPVVMDGSGKGDGLGWWDERNDYNLADDTSTGVTAHYTQMVSSNVYAMGCATQRCGAPGPFGWDGEWWWTICQYGPRGDAYWVGNRPYETGQGGLVDPPDSVFEQHPGLCGP